MQIVIHDLWPVSYIDDQGRQINSLYTFDPSRVDETYWVGQPLQIAVGHIADMEPDAKAKKIAALKATLKELEA